MANTFPRYLWITLYAVEKGPEDIPVLKQPIEATDYKISPFTIADTDAVDAWIRQRSLETFIETANAMKNLDKKDFLELVANETRRVSNISWSSSEGVKLLTTIDGLSFLIWQVIHKGTTLTHGQLRDMFFVLENQKSALETVRRLNCLDTWGVSHPTQARSQGQNQTVTQTTQQTTLEELAQKHTSSIS